MLKTYEHKLLPNRKNIEFKDDLKTRVFELSTNCNLGCYSEQQITGREASQTIFANGMKIIVKSHIAQKICVMSKRGRI